jgi:hypothetical protein
MTDHRLQILAGRVERIVAPLAVSRKRKELMREELLAHLCEAYEQELALPADDDAATEAAMRRLGEVAELTGRLQASAPAPEMILFLCGGRKEILMSRWFWLLLGVLAAFFGTGLILPALAKFKEIAQLFGTKAHAGDALVGLAIGEFIFLVGLALAVHALIRIIRSPHKAVSPT